MRTRYLVRIDGVPMDFATLPFGRQLDHRATIERFKATAKSMHVSAKHTTTAKAFARFKREFKPVQWFTVDRDGPMYHDDSFEVWYTL